MKPTEMSHSDETLRLTAQIVSAHVAHNLVDSAEVAPLIKRVYETLRDIGAIEPVPAQPLHPAVPVKRSVFPDHLICLEDGKKLKMLKRHLSTAYGMTPTQYREKWGLPPDYPMVAPDYANTRSRLAKTSGLGRSRHHHPVAPMKSRHMAGATSDA